MARRKGYVFTPARARALEKARRARSLKAKSRRKTNASKTRRIYGRDPIKRGIGVSGARKNFVPYIRVNKRSQTVGGNTGTIIPFTGKRLVTGGYIRVENTTRRNAVDTALEGVGNRIARRGTKPGAVRNWVSKNVTVTNPAVRVSVGGQQIRLGSSRNSGATLIVRRGKHKTPQLKSKAGVKKYDNRMRALAAKRGVKKVRSQRRGRR